MTWNYKTSNLATYVDKVRNKAIGFLQKQDTGYILLEDGSKIIIDDIYTLKNSNPTSWTYK